MVRLGEHRKSTIDDCKQLDDGSRLCADPVQDIAVTENNLIIHPEYNKRESTHDIALIRLNEAAKVHQNNIKPICLPFQNKFKALPASMVVIGFGRTEVSESHSDVLMKANVKTKTNEQCISEYENAQLNLIDNQFCAGGEFLF
jgi:hypothetical protein